MLANIIVLSKWYNNILESYMSSVKTLNWYVCLSEYDILLLIITSCVII